MTSAGADAETLRSPREPRAAPRPWWMTGLSLFCVATVLFLVPRDLFYAETRDVEVWLGFELRGAAALATAPLHWLCLLYTSPSPRDS